MRPGASGRSGPPRLGTGRPSEPVAAVVLAGHDGSLPRLALSIGEACATLGVGRDYFRLHVEPELRVARVGRSKRVPVSELVRWLDVHAEAAGIRHLERNESATAAGDSEGARQSRASEDAQ